VCGGVRHPAAAARGAEPAPLAGERHQAIVTTAVAVDPHEPEGEDAALEESAELAFDEARRHPASILGANEERGEPVRDDLIKQALLGPAGLVLRRGDASAVVEASGTGTLQSQPR